MRIVIAPGRAGADASTTAPPAFNATPFTLPHPRTGAPAQWLLIDDRIYEAALFRPPTAAWFAGEAVVSDGGCALVTPVDPLLLALPLLAAARGPTGTADAGPGQFRDAEQALLGGDAAGPDAVRALLTALAAAAGGEPEEVAAAVDVAKADGGDGDGDGDVSPPTTPATAAHARTLARAASALASVCETRAVGPDTYVRLHDDRTAAWLRLKAAAVGAALRTAAGGTGAAAGLDDAGAAAAGAALLADWLSPAAAASVLGVPTEAEAAAARTAAVAAARAAANAASGGGGRPASGEWESAEDRAKRLKTAAADKARRKAAEARADAKAAAAKKEAAGMKSLSSFFVKKAA